MVKVREDMTGWRMWEHGVHESRLIVVKQIEDYIDPKGVHVARWLCRCNCGSDKDIVATGNNIRHGSVLSCGCKAKEASARVWNEHFEEIKQVLRKTNIVDLSGQYGIGWTTNTNKEFYFDLEDYDKIKDYCWVDRTRKNGYSELVAHVPGTNNKIIRMSDLLGFKTYDHINRNPLDNRKENFRPATVQENIRNSSISKNNTSGVKGISWSKRDSVWRAYIMIDYKQKCLGSYKNKEDAIRARLQAEKQYFGEFAPQRHLFKEYGIEDEFLEDSNDSSAAS